MILYRMTRGNLALDRIINSYNILFVYEGWIYFQSSSAEAETGGYTVDRNISKMKPDGREVTKLNDWGFEGGFIGIKDGWAYFDASSYGEEYYESGRINLETGERNTLTEGACVIGMLGDKLYYQPDDSMSVYSLDLETLQREHIVATRQDWDFGIMMEGNKIYEFEYETGETNLLHTMDIAPYSSGDISEKGDKYYVEESWEMYNDPNAKLYRKNLNTGEETLILSR